MDKLATVRRICLLIGLQIGQSRRIIGMIRHSSPHFWRLLATDLDDFSAGARLLGREYR
jgi:hypothetical protein